MKLRQIVLVLALSWPVSGLADFDVGFKAYEAGDYATALREWRPLAEQGHADAQYNLGVMHDKGRGVPQDYNEAVKWFRLAAEQGDALAQYNLGIMYRNGEGVSQDDVEAVKWYRLAAEQGYVSAQSNLGIMYFNGEGVPEDYPQAYAWLNLSAAQGNKKAIKGRDIIKKEMIPSQIAEGQKMSRELYKRINKK